MEYFKKYPSFKKCIFGPEGVTKLCCVVEKFCYKKGIKKMDLVLEISEEIVGRHLSEQEHKQIVSTIDFIHKKGLIKVSYWVKLWFRITDIFR